MKIFPAVHYSMGGLWVDYDQMTNIPGLFAAGECDYSQHGANRLGANSLLSAIFGGMVAGPKALEYMAGLNKRAEDVSSSVFGLIVMCLAMQSTKDGCVYKFSLLGKEN